MDEHQLVSALRNREPAAVQEFVQSCGDRLLRSAFLLCGSEADAQDLVQETFLKALQSVHRFQGRCAIYTWLRAILLNLTRHYHRTRKRFASTNEVEELSTAPAGEQQLDAEFASSTLTNALSRLSPAHREVLVLRFYEDLKIHEIAAHIGVSRGTVKSRLHYAIAEMQKLLPAELNLFGPQGTKTIEKR